MGEKHLGARRVDPAPRACTSPTTPTTSASYVVPVNRNSHSRSDRVGARPELSARRCGTPAPPAGSRGIGRLEYATLEERHAHRAEIISGNGGRVRSASRLPALRPARSRSPTGSMTFASPKGIADTPPAATTPGNARMRSSACWKNTTRFCGVSFRAKTKTWSAETWSRLKPGSTRWIRTKLRTNSPAPTASRAPRHFDDHERAAHVPP